MLFQAVGTILVGLWTVKIVIYREYRRMMLGLRQDKVVWATLAFIAINYIVLAIKGHKSLAMNYMFNLHLGLLLYMVARTSLFSKQIHALLNLLVATVVMVAVIGIAQNYGLVLADTEMDDKSKVYSTVGNSNSFGAYLMMALPVALASCLAEKARIRRLIAFFGLVIIAAGLLYSRAFAALIGALGAVVLFALLIPRNARRSALKMGAYVFVIGATGCYWYFDELILPLAGRIHVLVTQGLPAVIWTRWPLWMASLSLVEKSPFIGHGVNSFVLVAPEALAEWYLANPKTPIFPKYPDYAHNEYIQAALELGIPGLIAMLSPLAVCFCRWKIHGAGAEDGLNENNVREPYIYALGCGTGLVALAINALANFPLHLVEVGFLCLLLAALSANILHPIGGGIGNDPASFY
jgi:O-antigen ligase